MATKTRKPRPPVLCLDCHVWCAPDNRCACCVAIQRDHEQED